MLRTLWIAVAFLSLVPTFGAALPLIFVQATVTLIADENGALEAIGMDWLYDAEFTHLLAHEVGADEDETMQLSPEEIQRLRELVLNWPPEFNGDLHVSADDREIALLPREGAEMTLEFGHIREKFLRPIVQSGNDYRSLQIKLYDPYYITAYSIRPEIEIRGDLRCPAHLVKGDLDAAHDAVSATLGGVQVGDLTGEDDYPPFGEAFTDIVVLDCR